MRRRELGFGLCLGLACVTLSIGCGPRPLAAPPTAPLLLSAADLIPSDLDVVVRLDLGRVKSVLGAPALQELARATLAHGSAGQDPGGLMVASMLDAELLFLGFRPGPAFSPLDRVLALQGRFEQLATPPLGFSGVTDLGGDVRYWDRARDRMAGKPARARSETARLYTFGERLRAFVSEAEIDAVERALAGFVSERKLTPPEKGTLSLSARPWLLAGLLGGDTLSELLMRAKLLSLVADLESDGALFELRLELGSAGDAALLESAAAEVLRRLSSSTLAASARLTRDAERFSMVVRLSREQLAGAVACLRAPDPSGCTW